MKTKYILIVIAIILLAVIAYGIFPLFNVIEINDTQPEGVLKNPKIESGTVHLSEKQFEVIGTTGHPASGFVRIITEISGVIVRYENFKTINGPDLYVYLSKDLDAKDFINLGQIKGTVGNINYYIPEGTNISEYKYVLTWCKTFGVLFNYAEIKL